jgi:hypothetical protein
MPIISKSLEETKKLAARAGGLELEEIAIPESSLILTKKPDRGLVLRKIDGYSVVLVFDH